LSITPRTISIFETFNSNQVSLSYDVPLNYISEKDTPINHRPEIKTPSTSVLSGRQHARVERPLQQKAASAYNSERPTPQPASPPVPHPRPPASSSSTTARSSRHQRRRNFAGEEARAPAPIRWPTATSRAGSSRCAPDLIAPVQISRRLRSDSSCSRLF
jgi:hypothetical protein